MACSTRAMEVTAAVALAVAILATVGVVVLQVFFFRIVQSKLPLVNGTEAFNMWRDIPLPIYQRFYFFNLTNAEDFYRHGAKPKVIEVGPYTYRATWIKSNLEWNSNQTLSYREVKSYFFDREASIGSEDDIITTLNAPLVTAGAKLSEVSPLKRLIIASVVNLAGEKLVIKKPVGQLLYQGYGDVLATLGHMLDPTVPSGDGKFGWMHERNATDDGLFTVYTGGGGQLEKYNIIAEWNGEQHLTWWRGECNMINGTNGELVPPLKDGQDKLYIFITDFCRSWTLEYSRTVGSYGINLERFVAPASTFQNGSEYPPNACFATKRHLRSGAMDISRCQHGAPVVVSFPHFYQADPSYLDAVDGLHPDSFRHSFHLDVEPSLGLALGLNARLQVNLALEKVPAIRGLGNITEMTFPVFWQEINIELTEAFADHLKSEMVMPLFYGTMACYLLIGVGSGVALGACAVVVGRRVGWLSPKEDESTSSLISDAEGGDGPGKDNRGVVVNGNVDGNPATA